MDYNRNVTPNPQGMVKVLPVIHLALMVGQLLFGIAVYTIQPQKGFSLDGSHDPLVYVAMMLALGGFIGGNLFFKQMLNKIPAENTVTQKVAAYQSACIIRFALLEGPSLFSIVGYMLSGNLFFLTVAGLIILYFLTLRPTKDRIITDLALDYNQQTELDSRSN